ncbi:MAG: 4'-phosphopantetheinyl transferase superfamily protein [Gemmataceae bacterium]
MLLGPGNDEVDLWHVSVDELPAELLERVCRDWLSGEEKERYERYRHEGARQMFLAGRWLVRAMLSRYAALEPAAWRFRANGHGRPEIAMLGLEGLRFNLSHSAGVLLLGVARERDIGVDVEHVNERRDLLGIAHHSFSAVEIEQVERAAPHERAERFFAIWTLKEAYIKARGMGLAFPLDRFAVRTESVSITRFEVDADLDPAPADWHLHDWRLRPAHHAALFVRGRELKIWLRHPLQPDAEPESVAPR